MSGCACGAAFAVALAAWVAAACCFVPLSSRLYAVVERCSEAVLAALLVQLCVVLENTMARHGHVSKAGETLSATHTGF